MLVCFCITDGHFFSPRFSPLSAFSFFFISILFDGMRSLCCCFFLRWRWLLLFFYGNSKFAFKLDLFLACCRWRCRWNSKEWRLEHGKKSKCAKAVTFISFEKCSWFHAIFLLDFPVFSLGLPRSHSLSVSLSSYPMMPCFVCSCPMYHSNLISNRQISFSTAF